jgi:Caspase domain/High potential iron-sulfur protein
METILTEVKQMNATKNKKLFVPNRRFFITYLVPISSNYASNGYAQTFVNELEPQAAALAFKFDAKTVDKSKNPKYTEGQRCGNCGLFQGKSSDSFGLCPLFAAKRVPTGGWCSAYNRSVNFLSPESNSKLAIEKSDMEKYRLETEAAKKKLADAEDRIKLIEQESSQTANIYDSTPTDKRIALVIGNSNYKIRPLKNPRNDADDVSSSLLKSGFTVIELRDASLAQMRFGVRQFGDRLLNYDVGLVYYSGHGVEIKGRNYFIPVNADIMREDEIADQALDVNLILEKMNSAGKGVNILIVDACRDDPFGRSFRSTSRGLAQIDAPKGTIIAYATSPGRVAADGVGRNSPYTKNLIKAMQQINKPIEQVFKDVRRAVQLETSGQQIPWENTSLSGDFYFRFQK